MPPTGSARGTKRKRMPHGADIRNIKLCKDMNDIVEIQNVSTLEAVNRSEIDMQIATAKKYPRDIAKSLDNIKRYAMADEETAGDCFYALKRSDGDETKLVEGLSVRLAEIFASCWGNLRIATRIVSNDGKAITAQGMCHDLETNLAVITETKRRITNRYGKTYSEDMQMVTSNAATSIAFRNAVFKVIPKAITKSVVDEIRAYSQGKTNEFAQKRDNAMAWFAKAGVTKEEVFRYLEVGGVNEIDSEKLMLLRSTRNALKEGLTTIDDTFRPQPSADEKKAEMRASGRGPVEMM